MTLRCNSNHYSKDICLTAAQKLLFPVDFTHHGFNIDRCRGCCRLGLFLLLLLPKDNGIYARVSVPSILLQLGRAKKRSTYILQDMHHLEILWNHCIYRTALHPHINIIFILSQLWWQNPTHGSVHGKTIHKINSHMVPIVLTAWLFKNKCTNRQPEVMRRRIQGLLLDVFVHWWLEVTEEGVL